MITPQFSLEQTDTQLMITIIAPYTNVKDTEITVIEDDFRFYSKPYYLRLTLPGKVEETERSSAKYHVDTNSFVVTLDKMTPGEVFENLDLLTAMLQPHTSKNVTAKKPLIEVLPGNEDEVVEEEDDDDDSEIDENEWLIEQKMEEDLSPEALLNQHKYGFANTHSGLVNKFEAELGEVAEIRNPDSLSPLERRRQRLETERTQFSEDHYIADLMENEDVMGCLQFKFKWKEMSTLSSSDQEQMKNLQNREFLLDKTWQKRLQLGLFDVIFAFCYDTRITKGEHCVETPWTISRISSTLSWFEVFDTVEEVLQSTIRRSLSYPLYRHWKLSIKVLNDTLAIFKLGPVALLKCLLQIRKRFCKKDPYYLLNQLYIDEYCVWIQTKTTTNFETMIEAFQKSIQGLSKTDIDFDLVELEAAAAAVEDEEMEEEMSSRVSGVTL